MPETVPGASSSATHQYSNPGTFTISATGTDDVGTFPAGNTLTIQVV